MQSAIRSASWSYECEAPLEGFGDTVWSHERFRSTAFEYVFQACAINFAQIACMLVGVTVALLAFPRAVHVLAPRRKKGGTLADFRGWLLEAFTGKAAEGSISIDGMVLVRFCRLGLKFSLLGTVVGGMLVPVYAGGHNDASGFLHFTISNLDEMQGDSSRFVAAVVAAYVLAGSVLYLLVCEWRHFVAMQRDHLLRRAQGKEGASAAQAQYSVLVERVPLHAQESEDCLRRFFEQLLGEVHSCALQKDTTEMYHHQTLAKVSEKVCCCCCSEGCLHYGFKQGIEGVVTLERGTAHLLRTVLSEGGSSTSTAFVTFREARWQAVAHQVILFNTRGRSDADFMDWVLYPAPEARDILWFNASMPKAFLDKRQKLGFLVCACGLVFWSFPIIFIQSIATIDAYESVIPWLNNLLADAGLYSVVTGYLPVVALMLMLVVLPHVLMTLAIRVEALKTKTSVHRKVLIRNFWFQLATLVVTILSCSMWKALRVIVERPSCIAEILGVTIPGVSRYFTTFVIARCGTSLPLLVAWPLLRLFWPPGQIWRKLVKDEYDAPPIYCFFAVEATDVAVVLSVGLVYAVIAPTILPFCAMYFGLASVTYHWMFRNVYEQEFDCKGHFWFELFDSAMAGLLLGTLSLGGVMSTYTGLWDVHPTALWVLAGFIAFMHAEWNWRWRPLCHAITFQDAAAVDSDTSEFGSKEVVKSFDPRFYVDPIIKLIDANDAASNPEVEAYEPDETPGGGRTPIVPPTCVGRPQLEACKGAPGKVHDRTRRPSMPRPWLCWFCPERSLGDAGPDL